LLAHIYSATLNLRINLFAGPIATTIGQLPASLTSLDLSANAFTGTLPSELGQVVALTDLKMARSDFQPTPDGTCGDVNANPLGCIRGTIPTELGQLVNLRTLWLFEHSLTGTLPTEFGNMASLSEFLVYANAVSGDVPAPFVALPSLGKLDSILLSICTVRTINNSPSAFRSRCRFVDEFLWAHTTCGAV
jgi:hypothetical protein